MPLEDSASGRRKPRNLKEWLADAYFRVVPNFMVGWPTWFGNRRAEGVRGNWETLRYELSELLTRRR